MGKVLKHVRTHRGANTQTMVEESPAYDSRSNGFIERAVQSVKSQIRTMRLALQNKVGPLTAGMCIVPWLMEHAANLLTLYEVRKD